ncbi:hypothetical protein GALLR39Z86_32680 [Glycomyces algeriensis]|uniref:Uncharacterized protein n=1 Tax=Glycomyces algeriensis TaxID=256037 RepID=A0A9W6GAZ6_9ACTN|nr:hypothetical protein GALLR39Z86_32680 [Glycomyces algeriensis]
MEQADPGRNPLATARKQTAKKSAKKATRKTPAKRTTKAAARKRTSSWSEPLGRPGNC